MVRCSRCQAEFDPDDPDDPDHPAGPCRYHPGELKGCLATFNSIHQTPWNKEGTDFILDNIDEDGPWWFWTCCDSRGKTAPGCTEAPRHTA